MIKNDSPERKAGSPLGPLHLREIGTAPGVLTAHALVALLVFATAGILLRAVALLDMAVMARQRPQVQESRRRPEAPGGLGMPPPGRP
jgi:hypothetical protein